MSKWEFRICLVECNLHVHSHLAKFLEQSLECFPTNSKKDQKKRLLHNRASHFLCKMLENSRKFKMYVFCNSNYFSQEIMSSSVISFFECNNLRQLQSRRIDDKLIVWKKHTCIVLYKVAQ